MCTTKVIFTLLYRGFAVDEMWIVFVVCRVDRGGCRVGRGEAASLWQPLSHMMLDNLNRPTILIIIQNLREKHS